MTQTADSEGVFEGTTRLSRVRGEIGQLTYLGYDVVELSDRVCFEDVCHLLWQGALPDREAARTLRERILSEAGIDDRVIEIARVISASAHPMSALRASLSACGCLDDDAEDRSAEAASRCAIRLTAQASTLTACIGRLRAGRRPLQPARELGLAANFLYMLHGREPDGEVARALDVALILHAEHGLNPSTLAVRVAASTGTDMYSAVAAGIATLKGGSHGGAAERVMRMLQSIGSPERAGSWVNAVLDRGDRVPGFGHHEYRTVDPRAPILEALSHRLHEGTGAGPWAEVSSAVRKAMAAAMKARGKAIYPNVDFYSAPVFRALGIPPALFGCMFACARMAGWTAHVMEQRGDRPAIRAQARYSGPADRRIDTSVDLP